MEGITQMRRNIELYLDLNIYFDFNLLISNRNIFYNQFISQKK